MPRDGCRDVPLKVEIDSSGSTRQDVDVLIPVCTVCSCSHATVTLSSAPDRTDGSAHVMFSRDANAAPGPNDRVTIRTAFFAGVRSLQFAAPKDLPTSLAADFARHATDLTVVDLTRLGGLRAIGDSAFRRSGISELRLPTEAPIDIGDDFCVATTALRSVDWRQTPIRTIGRGAFADSAVTRILLRDVTTIGDDFCARAEHLEHASIVADCPCTVGVAAFAGCAKVDHLEVLGAAVAVDHDFAHGARIGRAFLRVRSIGSNGLGGVQL